MPSGADGNVHPVGCRDRLADQPPHHPHDLSTHLAVRGYRRPADWDLIASAEAKTNPRVREQVGDLSLVPVHRRLFGPTASIAMSAFTHVSRDRPGRFSDGNYGVWYCGDRFEVALMETAYHFERFMRRTNEPAGDAQYRELTTRIVGSLHDLRDNQFPECLAPDDWRPAQSLAASLRDSGSDGIVYPASAGPRGKLPHFSGRISYPSRSPRRRLSNITGRVRNDRYFVIGGSDWYALPDP